MNLSKINMKVQELMKEVNKLSNNENIKQKIEIQTQQITKNNSIKKNQIS